MEMVISGLHLWLKRNDELGVQLVLILTKYLMKETILLYLRMGRKHDIEYILDFLEGIEFIIILKVFVVGETL
jgi:hypothetical protein